MVYIINNWDAIEPEVVEKFRHLPADAEARINEASLDELDAWTESILSAKSLDEVFTAKPR